MHIQNFWNTRLFSFILFVYRFSLILCVMTVVGRVWPSQSTLWDFLSAPSFLVPSRIGECSVFFKEKQHCANWLKRFLWHIFIAECTHILRENKNTLEIGTRGTYQSSTWLVRNTWTFVANLFQKASNKQTNEQNIKRKNIPWHWQQIHNYRQ